MSVCEPHSQIPLVWTYGLAVSRELLDHGVDDGGVDLCTGRITRARRVNGSIRLAQHTAQRSPVDQVHHDGLGTFGPCGVSGDLRSHHSSHRRATLDERVEDSASDIAGRSGQGDFHGRPFISY